MIILIITLSLLAGCESSHIVDLIHPETYQKDRTVESLSNEVNKPFVVEDILFILYSRQGDAIPINPADYNNREAYQGSHYYLYDLRLAAYKEKENLNSVTINYVIVEGKKNIVLDKIQEEVHSPMNFRTYKENPSLKVSNEVLIKEINQTDMKLVKDSTISVIVNVTVTTDEGSVVKDLHYEIETDRRSYGPFAYMVTM